MNMKKHSIRPARRKQKLMRHPLHRTILMAALLSVAVHTHADDADQWHDFHVPSAIHHSPAANAMINSTPSSHARRTTASVVANPKATKL